MSISVLIVDDESLARARVKTLLAGEADLEVIGECDNGPAAIAFIQEKRPELVFLDVQMPEVSGLDVVRALPKDCLPGIVFVTAHDQHAIEAFEVHALDYLLKPFSQARLQASVGHARKYLQVHNSGAVNQRLEDWLKAAKSESACLNRIAIKNGDRTIFIKVEDVDYIESASNYVIIHTKTENHMLRETLMNLEARLSSKLFLRISRSVIVNLNRIKELQPNLRGEYVIILYNNVQLPMSRSLREVQEKLQYS
jgi:two-component system, LytTR family, response regulator